MFGAATVEYAPFPAEPASPVNSVSWMPSPPSKLTLLPRPAAAIWDRRMPPPLLEVPPKKIRSAPSDFAVCSWVLKSPAWCRGGWRDRQPLRRPW